MRVDSLRVGKSQLDRRLTKLETDLRLRARLCQESVTGARQQLLDRIKIIRESQDAARARGEEVPTADRGVVEEILRQRLATYRHNWQAPQIE